MGAAPAGPSTNSIFFKGPRYLLRSAQAPMAEIIKLWTQPIGSGPDSQRKLQMAGFRKTLNPVNCSPYGLSGVAHYVPTTIWSGVCCSVHYSWGVPDDLERD